MTTKFAALFLAAAPLLAQATDPIPFELGLEVRVAHKTLGLVCWSADADPKAIAIVVANSTGATIDFEGLPPLLIPEVVMVCGRLADGLTFEAPFLGLPFDLHLQAAGFVWGQLAVSERRVVAAGYDPYGNAISDPDDLALPLKPVKPQKPVPDADQKEPGAGSSDG